MKLVCYWLLDVNSVYQGKYHFMLPRHLSLTTSLRQDIKWMKSWPGWCVWTGHHFLGTDTTGSPTYWPSDQTSLPSTETPTSIPGIPASSCQKRKKKSENKESLQFLNTSQALKMHKHLLLQIWLHIVATLQFKFYLVLDGPNRYKLLSQNKDFNSAALKNTFISVITT